MQTFYKVTQGYNEKVPSFVMRLEGTLNEIRLQCPGRMTDLEFQQHLKVYLFHGVKKHICESIWYLYSTPRTYYSQLMVTTLKVESENEEFSDKVRARATVVTDWGEGMADWGSRLPSSWLPWPRLSRATAPLVYQVAPRKGAMGGDTKVVALPVTQIPVMVWVGLDRWPKATVYPLGMGQGATEMEAMDRVTKGLMQGQKVQPIFRIPTPSNASCARGGATWPGNALPQHWL